MALANGKTQKETAYDATKEILDAVNIMGNDKEVVEGIVEALQHNHRTLQQNYWRVMMQVIKEYSEFRHDMRNEGSVDMCKFIKEQVEKHHKEYLPYV
jgi:phosphoenolpyruvate-protein kinase (PTS system EI component)